MRDVSGLVQVPSSNQGALTDLRVSLVSFHFHLFSDCIVIIRINKSRKMPILLQSY